MRNNHHPKSRPAAFELEMSSPIDSLACVRNYSSPAAAGKKTKLNVRDNDEMRTCFFFCFTCNYRAHRERLAPGGTWTGHFISWSFKIFDRDKRPKTPPLFFQSILLENVDYHFFVEKRGLCVMELGSCIYHIKQRKWNVIGRNPSLGSPFCCMRVIDDPCKIQF